MKPLPGRSVTVPVGGCFINSLHEVTQLQWISYWGLHHLPLCVLVFQHSPCSLSLNPPKRKQVDVAPSTSLEGVWILLAPTPVPPSQKVLGALGIE